MPEYFWGAGEQLYYFRDFGSTNKIIFGSRGKYFRGAGEIWVLFSGSKGALTPPPPGEGALSDGKRIIFSY